MSPTLSPCPPQSRMIICTGTIGYFLTENANDRFMRTSCILAVNPAVPMCHDEQGTVLPICSQANNSPALCGHTIDRKTYCALFLLHPDCRRAAGCSINCLIACRNPTQSRTAEASASPHNERKLEYQEFYAMFPFPE
jgi:hypothetical protein